MTEYELTPKTRPVLVSKLRIGHIVVTQHEFPAIITAIRITRTEVRIRARYVWSAATEPDWLLGTYSPTSLIEKAINK